MKTKLGISAGLLGAAVFFLALVGGWIPTIGGWLYPAL